MLFWFVPFSRLLSSYSRTARRKSNYGYIDNTSALSAVVIFYEITGFQKGGFLPIILKYR